MSDAPARQDVQVIASGAMSFQPGTDVYIRTSISNALREQASFDPSLSTALSDRLRTVLVDRMRAQDVSTNDPSGGLNQVRVSSTDVEMNQPVSDSRRPDTELAGERDTFVCPEVNISVFQRIDLDATSRPYRLILDACQGKARWTASIRRPAAAKRQGSYSYEMDALDDVGVLGERLADHLFGRK